MWMVWDNVRMLQGDEAAGCDATRVEGPTAALREPYASFSVTRASCSRVWTVWMLWML